MSLETSRNLTLINRKENTRFGTLRKRIEEVFYSGKKQLDQRLSTNPGLEINGLGFDFKDFDSLKSYERSEILKERESFMLDAREKQAILNEQYPSKNIKEQVTFDSTRILTTNKWLRDFDQNVFEFNAKYLPSNNEDNKVETMAVVLPSFGCIAGEHNQNYNKNYSDKFELLANSFRSRGIGVLLANLLGTTSQGSEIFKSRGFNKIHDPYTLSAHICFQYLKKKFPNLKTLDFVGESLGAVGVATYSSIAKEYGFQINNIVQIDPPIPYIDQDDIQREKKISSKKIKEYRGMVGRILDFGKRFLDSGKDQESQVVFPYADQKSLDATWLNETPLEHAKGATKFFGLGARLFWPYVLHITRNSKYMNEKLSSLDKQINIRTYFGGNSTLSGKEKVGKFSALNPNSNFQIFPGEGHTMLGNSARILNWLEQEIKNGNIILPQKY